MLSEELLNLARVLIGDESKVRLRNGSSGDDGLGIRALKAADEASDGQSGSDCGARIERTATLAPSPLRPSVL
jgi:hypothetical protein